MRIIAEVANITTSNLCVRCLPDTTKPQELTNGIVVASIVWIGSPIAISTSDELKTTYVPLLFRR